MSAKIGVLLTNLGTPLAPTGREVRKYLAEFLNDPYVIDYRSRWLWWLILHGIILRIRPNKVARAYQEIWDDNTGSPLRYISNEQCVKLAESLGDGYKVILGMRYGIPTIPDAMVKLKDCSKIIVLPMYPQYSITTTLSTIAKVRSCNYKGKLHFIKSYFDLPGYIEALVQSITTQFKRYGKPECLLFSFHGLPQRYIEEKGDPYYQQCLKTVELVATKLGLTGDEYYIAFQSRVGRERWLMPYTDELVTALAEQGVTKIAVICPGFAADCLETLEEINIRLRADFLENGGKEFHYIPALNVNETLVNALAAKILKV